MSQNQTAADRWTIAEYLCAFWLLLGAMIGCGATAVAVVFMWSSGGAVADLARVALFTFAAATFTAMLVMLWRGTR